MIAECRMRNAECVTPSPTLPLGGGGTGWGGLQTLNCGGSKGFTLIEIIILIVLAGILLPAIIIPFVTGVKGSGKAEMVTTAMYLAHQRMEEMMKFDYGRSPDLDPTALTAWQPAPITGYQWQWSRYYVDNNFQNPDLVTDRGYKQILVRVRDPENDTYEVTSVVTNFP